MADALSISTYAPEMNRIPVGARVDRAYYAVPTYYDRGDEFATEIEAMEDAIAKANEAAIGRDRDVQVTIDLRWSMSWSTSDSPRRMNQDFVVERTTYKNIGDAQIALDRRKRFSLPTETRS